MEYELVNVSVVDGDTIDATIDLGFDVHVEKRIRLYGINCPESRGPEKSEGLAAKTYLQERLLNSKVILKCQGKNEKFGRVLGTLVIDGQSINEEMISKGYAKAYFGEKRL